MTDVEKSFWERNFAEPRAAKYGCWGTFAAIPVALITWLALHPGTPNAPVTPPPSTSSSVTTIAAPPAPSRRVYTEREIEWEYAPDAISYKAKVVAGINRLLRENERCTDVQTTSLYRTPKFSKKNPEFYINCVAADGTPFGATFNVNNPENKDTSFRAATIIDEALAKRLCMGVMDREPEGLRSISFNALFNGNFISHPDGRATIALAFSAKNPLGILDDYKIVCFFTGMRLTDHKVKPS